MDYTDMCFEYDTSERFKITRKQGPEVDCELWLTDDFALFVDDDEELDGLGFTEFVQEPSCDEVVVQALFNNNLRVHSYDERLMPALQSEDTPLRLTGGMDGPTTSTRSPRSTTPCTDQSTTTDGAPPPIPETDDIVAVFREDDDDGQRIVFPASVREIEMPVFGLRPERIRHLREEVERLTHESINLCRHIGYRYVGWISVCEQQLVRYTVQMRKVFRSPEKRIIAELYLKSLWLKEWLRRLNLRKEVLDSQLGPTINPIAREMTPQPDNRQHRRYLNERTYLTRHSYRGSKTFSQLLVLLFGTDSVDIANAKLELLATSDEACMRYSRTQIYTSFLKLCSAAALTMTELLSYSLTVLPSLRGLKSQKICLCGRLDTQMSGWKIHECRFERWLIDLGLATRRGPTLSVKDEVNWEQVLKDNDPSTLSIKFDYLDFTPTRVYTDPDANKEFA
uniref:Uncharacterized protein n=1 Tax=Photinus pyralis TaxID=7054 RepID=A0A1Y1N8H8_PHOPY